MPAEGQDAQLVLLVDDFLYRAGDECGSNSAMTDSDALVHETSADATEVETAPAELAVTESQASSFEEAGDASNTKKPSMEVTATGLTTDFGAAEPGTGEAGPCATPTAEAPTLTPTAPTTIDENVVELADFDPERDVIGVFYAKSIDAQTGKPTIPKVRASGNSDGPGHIISLDGCDVAHVIGAEDLTEHHVKLIAE